MGAQLHNSRWNHTASRVSTDGTTRSPGSALMGARLHNSRLDHMAPRAVQVDELVSAVMSAAPSAVSPLEWRL